MSRAARELEIDPAESIADPVERLAVASSHPAWLIERWTRAFGNQEAEAFARANNHAAANRFPRRQTARVRSRGNHTTPRRGPETSSLKIAKHAWRFTGRARSLTGLVASGHVYLQDEASQLVAELLAAQPGDRFLDLCAAPGSKTTQIADGLGGSGSVVAADLYAHRLRSVRDTAKLQNLGNIHCLALDGLAPLPFKESAFDRVLVDAPCSGTGTLRRNPEIRWRISADDIDDLSLRQKQLLHNAARVVKPGGRLVYSTCSVEPEENELVVQMFLENNINFSLIHLPFGNALTIPGTARTWPQHQDTDGFFIAAFARNT